MTLGRRLSRALADPSRVLLLVGLFELAAALVTGALAANAVGSFVASAGGVSARHGALWIAGRGRTSHPGISATPRPLGIAVLGACVSIALALALAPSPLVLAGLSITAIAPVEALVRAALEPSVRARIDGPLGIAGASQALTHFSLALGPALITLGFSSTAAPSALIALGPALWLAAQAARGPALTRAELETMPARIARLDPNSPSTVGIELQTVSAQHAWTRVLEILAEATHAVRTHTEAHQQIEQESQIRSRFMAAMGHELRSPLNSIVGFAQLLEDGADGPLAPAQRDSVVLIRRSAQELLRLLTDILDSARLDADRLKLRRAWTPSVELVTEAVRQGRAIIEGQGVQIETSVQPGLPPVSVDRERIVQAVVAAFRHAAQNKTGGTLEVSAQIGKARDGRPSLLVEVRDPARTLASEELERVFDAFRDLREPRTGRRIGGLGLALSLARKLVRLHGGEVWAESRRQGGTRYVVALPIEARARV